MRNILIVTPKRLTREEVQEFVETQGGYWDENPTLDQGVIEEGNAAVYISGDVGIHSFDYEPIEFEALEQLIGAEPKALVDLHIGHAAGSFQLAEKVARLMIGQWGGYLDYNDQPIRPPSQGKADQ